jgi:uncharacterized protein (TIGR02391 family)
MDRRTTIDQLEEFLETVLKININNCDEDEEIIKWYINLKFFLEEQFGKESDYLFRLSGAISVASSNRYQIQEKTRMMMINSRYHGGINVRAEVNKLESVANTKLQAELEGILKACIRQVENIEPIENNVQISFWYLIHPKITKVSQKLFDHGHYADSVEAAFKEVNVIVKECHRRKTGKELDGADLMRTAFSVNNPTITLDDLDTISGKDVQQGYMHLFEGSMLGIRNPKAHANITIDEDRATHLIFLASLLLFKFDERI